MGLSNRELIEKRVRENKGITFSELKKKTGLANGVLQHHIHESEKITQYKGAIVPVEECKKCGLESSCNQVCYWTTLRDPKKKRIVRCLSEGKKQSEIAEELGIHESTASYHVNHLTNLKILKEKKPTPEAKHVLENIE